MNAVIETLMSHRSHRHYSDRPVNAEHLDTIIRAAQAAASWIHGQQVSIISVQNSQRKQKLAVLSGNQNHVAQAPVFLVFCADFYRAKLASDMEGAAFEAVADTDILLVGATDVGIAMANAMTAAESLGLGVLPVGGIRRSIQEVVHLLNLPQYVFPVAGLCIGYPDKAVSQKPRLPMAAVCHDEEYQHDLTDTLREYNETYRAYLKADGQPETDWSARVASFYAGRHYNGGFSDAAKALFKQGFTCEDMK